MEEHSKVSEFLQLLFRQDVQGLRTILLRDPDLTRRSLSGSGSGRSSKTPLLVIAVNFGNSSLVDLLLEYGACTEVAGQSGILPLYAAASQGHIEILQTLIKANAHLDAKHITGNTALQGAIITHQLEAVDVLIKAGCNINTANNAGETGLHIAASKNAVSIAQLLIDSGCDYNAVKSRIEERRLHGYGTTPLHIAAWLDHADFVDMLLHRGADVDKPTENGATSLHFACTRRSHAAAKNLLKRRPNLESICNPDTQPNTPLMLAIGNHDLVMVDALIEAGADVNKANDRGVSPLFKAVWVKIPGILSLLLENGLDPTCYKADRENRISLLVPAVNCTDTKFLEILIEAGYRMSEREIETSKLVEEKYRRRVFDILSNPLSMSTLCRVIIRKRIVISGKYRFKDSVRRLPIPEPMKDYILCRDLFR